MIQAQFRPLEIQLDRPAGGWRRSTFTGSFNNTLDTLEREIEHLRGKDIVVEVALDISDIRNDGWPRSTARPKTPGVRVSFNSKFGPLRYDCNTFNHWESNLRAIALGLQALRTVDRYGITKKAEQYKGFKALPDAIQAEEWPCVEAAAEWLYRQVFPNDMAGLVGGSRNLIVNRDILRDIWRKAAQESHPDLGGHNDVMMKINRAKDFIEKHGAKEAA